MNRKRFFWRNTAGAYCALLALAGCATDPATVGMLMQAQADVAKQPTLVLDCPSGCSMRYTDPRDKQLNVKLPTNGWDAAVAVTQSVTGLVAGAVPYAAVGAVAIHGLKHAGKNTTTTTTNTASGDGAATGGPASFHTEQIGPQSQNPTTNTTTTTDNSNQGNATATPTVVNQPAPVVVPAADPVIVTQPAPIVIGP